VSDLRTTVGPLTFRNPILTASGCCGYGLELKEFFPLDRLGALVVKGLSLKPREGNPPPRICETPAGMLNSIGLQNIGVEAFIGEVLPVLEADGIPVMANLFGEEEEAYVELARRCEAARGICAIELNLSCPNVKKGGIHFGTEPEAVAALTAKVRQVYTRSLWVKLSPNVATVVPLALAAQKAGADALTCINTLKGMAIDPLTWKARLHTTYGGLSGPAIKPVALRFVHETARAVDIPVVGCGGAATALDIVEFLLAGARAVQVGTLLFQNPALPVELEEGLRAYLDERGLANLDALIGKVKTHA
jgi:dihydroorotate dehydrogenase (NAD+) catalytic subunit